MAVTKNEMAVAESCQCDSTGSAVTSFLRSVFVFLLQVVLSGMDFDGQRAVPNDEDYVNRYQRLLFSDD